MYLLQYHRDLTHQEQSTFPHKVNAEKTTLWVQKVAVRINILAHDPLGTENFCKNVPL
jgi:hypothetical protein